MSISQERARQRQRHREAMERIRLQEQARFSIVLDTLRKAVTPLVFNPPTVILPPSRQGDEETAVLVLSDVHFGKKTARYNLAEAKNRFEATIDAALTVITLHRHAYPIKELIILWGGDIVDGTGIYPQQAHHSDANVVKQIFSTAPFVVEQLARLSAAFEKVRCYAVLGNHGRVSKFAHDFDNFDLIYVKTLELASQNLRNISWWTPLNAWHQVVNVRGTKILLFHGHQVKMHLNLPWYGITTRISRWAASNAVKSFDVSVCGHFHTSSCLRWNEKLIFTNGTLIAADDFALQVIGLESSQSQWLFGVHDRQKVTWRYELRP
ncbi:MAG: metallophosphoesterase [Nitrospiria bacterium]